MRLGLVVAGMAGLLWAGDGIRPRAQSADYAAHARLGDVTVGASVLTAEQARKTFGADLNRAGYVVVEVALYPENGAGMQIAADDFMLRKTRPVSARAVTDGVYRNENPAHGAEVYTSATVGYESSSAGNGRQHGVYTATSVGVGNRAPYPGPARDPGALEYELAGKALPEGAVSRAVAGYLYFAKPAGKSADYELTWYAPAGAVRLMVK